MARECPNEGAVRIPPPPFTREAFSGRDTWPMSANLDLVRSIYADWERGDFTRSDWADPEIELVVMDAPEAGTFKGLARAGDFWRQWLRSWDSYRAKAEEYRELDDGRVLVCGRMAGSGRSTGASVETTFLNVVHVRDGTVVRIVMYPSREAAIADLGLEE